MTSHELWARSNDSHLLNTEIQWACNEGIMKLITYYPENMKRRQLKFDTWAKKSATWDSRWLEIKRFSIRCDKWVHSAGHSQFMAYHSSLVYVRAILKGDRFEGSFLTPRAKKRACRSQGIYGALPLEWGSSVGTLSVLEFVCRERTRTFFSKDSRMCNRDVMRRWILPFWYWQSRKSDEALNNFNFNIRQHYSLEQHTQ